MTEEKKEMVGRGILSVGPFEKKKKEVKEKKRERSKGGRKGKERMCEYTVEGGQRGGGVKGQSFFLHYCSGSHSG